MRMPPWPGLCGGMAGPAPHAARQAGASLRPSGPGARMLLPWAGGGPGAIHFITRSNLDVILQNPRHAIPSQHHATPCDTLPNSLSPMAQPDKSSQPSAKPTHTIPHPLNTPRHATPSTHHATSPQYHGRHSQHYGTSWHIMALPTPCHNTAHPPNTMPQHATSSQHSLNIMRP
jgi:hypothetical protein